MKPNFLLILSFSFLLSCNITKEQTLTQEEKATIEQAIDLKISNMFDGWRELNLDKFLIQNLSNSNDFNYVGVKGENLNYDDMISTATGVFNSFDKADVPIKQKKIRVISDKVALCIIQYDVIFYKNGEAMSYPNLGLSLLFEKIEDNWMVTHFHESTQLPVGHAEE